MTKNIRGGDCYIVHGRYLLDNNLGDDWKIVHATVLGQGLIKGIRHGHCFLENNNIVLDFSNGKNLVMDKKKYYKLGQIRHTKKYNKNQFLKNINKYKNWGSWQ